MNGQREGIGIVEVILAMMFTSVLLAGLAGVTLTAARQLTMNSDASSLEAASLEAVNRLTTLPFASLDAAAGCDTVGLANARFQRCTSVTPAGNSVRVQVVTTPLQRLHVPASTVRFTRVAPAAANPLCVGC